MIKKIRENKGIIFLIIGIVIVLAAVAYYGFYVSPSSEGDKTGTENYYPGY